MSIFDRVRDRPSCVRDGTSEDRVVGDLFVADQREKGYGQDTPEMCNSAFENRRRRIRCCGVPPSGATARMNDSIHGVRNVPFPPGAGRDIAQVISPINVCTIIWLGDREFLPDGA